MEALSEEKRIGGRLSSSLFIGAGDVWVGTWRRLEDDDRRRSRTAGERTGGVGAGDGHGVIDGDDDS